VCIQPRPQPALETEDKHIDKPRDHRRHGKGEVDQGDEKAFPGNRNLAIAQEAATPEDEVQGDADRRRHQRELTEASASGSRIAAR